MIRVQNWNISDLLFIVVSTEVGINMKNCHFQFVIKHARVYTFSVCTCVCTVCALCVHVYAQYIQCAYMYVQYIQCAYMCTYSTYSVHTCVCTVHTVCVHVHVLYVHTYILLKAPCSYYIISNKHTRDQSSTSRG